MRERKSVRAGRVAAGLAAIGLVAGVVVACVELQGSLGSDCLKGTDCQSGVCSEQHCSSAPPVYDADLGPGAADATVDGSEASVGDGSAPEAAAPSDATPGSDVLVQDAGPIPADARNDAMDAGPAMDASADASADAQADARMDAAVID